MMGRARADVNECHNRTTCEAEEPCNSRIVEDLPDPIVIDAFVAVWDRPGMGIAFDAEKARVHLTEGDKDFSD